MSTSPTLEDKSEADTGSERRSLLGDLDSQPEQLNSIPGQMR